MSLPITRSTPLQHGDVVTIVGLEPSLSEAIAAIGVEAKATEVTDLVFPCVGILAGLLVGTLSTITYAIANVLLPVLGPIIVSLAFKFT